MCVGTSALQLLFRFFAVIFVALRQITLSLRNQAAGNFVWSKEIARLSAACSLPTKHLLFVFLGDHLFVSLALLHLFLP